MVFQVDSVEGQRIDRLTVTFRWRHRREARHRKMKKRPDAF